MDNAKSFLSVFFSPRYFQLFNNKTLKGSHGTPPNDTQHNSQKVALYKINVLLSLFAINLNGVMLNVMAPNIRPI